MSEILEHPPAPSLDDIKAFVRKAHAGQVDKAGHPYHEHVERVAARALSHIPREASTVFLQRVAYAALLHDIVEDTEYGFDDLLAMGYHPETVEIVKLLTKDPAAGLTYQAWIEQIVASGNIGAMIVKLSDNEDNANPERVALLGGERPDLLAKYEISIATLKAALAKAGVKA